MSGAGAADAFARMDGLCPPPKSAKTALRSNFENRKKVESQSGRLAQSESRFAVLHAHNERPVATWTRQARDSQRLVVTRYESAMRRRAVLSLAANEVATGS